MITLLKVKYWSVVTQFVLLQDNRIAYNYPYRTFPFPLCLPQDRNQLVQHNYFHSVLLHFCSRYPHRHQLCVDSHVRQFSLCGLILVSAFNLGLPKHHCRESSHLSQIFLFCLALLLANFSLETDAVEFLNSLAALDAAAKA